MGEAQPGMGFYLHDGEKYNDKEIDNDYIEHSSIVGHNVVIKRLDLSTSKGTESFKTPKLSDDMIDHGVAFDDIDVNKDYRMAVCMWSSKYKVEIIP